MSSLVAGVAGFLVAVAAPAVAQPPGAPAFFEPPPGFAADACKQHLDIFRRMRQSYGRGNHPELARQRAESERAMKEAWEACSRNLPKALFEPPPSEDAAACEAQIAPIRAERARYLAQGVSTYVKMFDGQMREAWENCQRMIQMQTDWAQQRELEARAATSKREMEEKAAAQRTQRRQAATERSEQPDWFVPVYSAQICAARTAQRRAKQAIAEEWSLARRSGGGFVDKEAIYQQQENMRDGENDERAARSELKARRKGPLPCSHRVVRQLEACLGDGESDGCDSAEVQAFFRVSEEMQLPE